MYHYINDKIKIDFPVTKNIREAMEDAEKYDREDNYGMYYNNADFIDIAAKECYVNHKLTKEQWDKLVERYQC